MTEPVRKPRRPRKPLLPSLLRVGPFTWKMGTFDNEVREKFMADGLCDMSSLVIGIYEGLVPQRQAEVAFHEILHACWFCGDLGDEAEEEKAVSVLAIQVMQVFRDNPEFRDWYFKNIQ
jgi:hypothetical protein